MAKNLKDKILKEVVKPHTSSSWGTVKATVVNYDNVRNRVDVRFQEPRGVGEMLLEKVPIQIGSNGVHSSGLKKGDQVWISFINNSPLLPKVVGIADEMYEINTREQLRHVRKGSLLSTVTGNCEKPKAKLTSVIDKSNDNIQKHYGFMSFDLRDKISDFRQNIGYYSNDEVGMSHPTNSSTVKIRDNGAVDIFTSTNHGVRVDPSTSTITINSNKGIVQNSNSINTNSKTWTIVCDDIVIESNTLNINCNKSININSPSLKINDKEVVK